MNYNVNYRPQVMNGNIHPQQLAALQAQAHYANLQQQHQAVQQQAQGTTAQLQDQQQQYAARVQGQLPHQVPDTQAQQQIAHGNIPQQTIDGQHYVNQRTGNPSPVQHYQNQSPYPSQSQHQQAGIIQQSPHVQQHHIQQGQQNQFLPQQQLHQGQQPNQQGIPQHLPQSQTSLQQASSQSIQGGQPQHQIHPHQLPHNHPQQGPQSVPPPQSQSQMGNQIQTQNHQGQAHQGLNQRQPPSTQPKHAQLPQQPPTPGPRQIPTPVPQPISAGGQQSQIQTQTITVPTAVPQSVGGAKVSSAKSARFPASATIPSARPLSATPTSAGTIPNTNVGSSGQARVVPVTSFNSNSAMTQMMNYKKQMSNMATLRFLDFCELIGVRSDSVKNILYWKKIVTDYFSEIGTMRYSVKSGVDSRQFEFSVPIIPRFFFSIIQSGVTRIEIQPGMLRTQVLANGMTYLESPRCCFTHYYSDGSYVKIHGNIKGILNQNLKLDWLDFQTHVFIPGVEWPSLEKIILDEPKIKQLYFNDSNEKNEKDDKKDNSKKLQILQNFRSNYQVFHSMSNFGLQESVMRVLQVSDVMAHLKGLMLFSTQTDQVGPLNALDNYVEKFYSKNEEINGKKPKSTTSNGNSASSSGSKQPGNQLKDDSSSKNSPSVEGQVDSSRGKVPALDISQSTLTKRRRKSTIGELSPKSLVDQHSPKPTVGKGSNKKTKR